MKITTYIYVLSITLLFTCFTNIFAADAEAEFIKIHRQYTLNTDGSTEVRYRKELKINTHRAMNSMYGETFIVYNPVHQQLKFHSSYTKQVDGNIVQTPANAFNEVLPAAAANAPAYNHLKEMVVTHTGLELGATIYLDYSIITSPGYLNQLDIAETLEELSPVKEYVITVNIPEGSPANYSLTGMQSNVNTHKENGFACYTWKLRNIPASSREFFIPQVAGYTPYFIFNTYSSVGDMLNVLNFGMDFSGIGTDKIVTKKDVPADEKINAIHRYIVKNMDYCRLSLIENGRLLRLPAKVMESAYGTAAEKAVLMSLLLYKEGIISTLGVLYPKELSIDVPGIAPIKEIGVITNYKGKKVFFSVSKDQVYAWDEMAYYYDILTMDNQGLRLLPANTTSETAASLFTQNIHLASDSVMINKTCELTGLIPGVYYKSDKYKVNRNNEGLTVFATDENERRKIAWDESGYFKFVPGEYAVGINGFNMSRLPSERKSAIAIPFKTDDKVVQTILLPTGITCKTPSYNRTLNNKAGTLDIKLSNEKGKVSIVKHIQLNKSIYSAAEYNDLRNLILEWNNPKINAVILYKETGKK